MIIARWIVLIALAALTLMAQAPAKQAETKPAKVKTEAAPTGIVDINSATAEQLMTVPGIGEAYAAKIVAGRPYRAKNELVDKKVLPAGVYAKVKDHLVAKQKK